MDIRRGMIRAFDSGSYLADVQIVGSMATTLIGVPVAKQIGAELLTAGTKCGVLFFDETNPSDGCVVFVYDGAPIPWVTSALIKDREIVEADLAFNPAVVNAAETISADWLFSGNKKLQFRDAQIYIQSANDGYLDLVADTAVRVASTLLGSSHIQSERAAAASHAFRALVSGDSQPRLIITAGGYIYFGPGDAAVDTVLYRSGANVLRVGIDDLIEIPRDADNWFQLATQIISAKGAETYWTYASYLSSGGVRDAYPRFIIRASGRLDWGPGDTTVDTYLSRISSGLLGVTGAFRSGNFAELVDGVSTPATSTGYARIYVDSADGDLKVRFGDGTIKTIVTDT